MKTYKNKKNNNFISLQECIISEENRLLSLKEQGLIDLDKKTITKESKIVGSKIFEAINKSKFINSNLDLFDKDKNLIGEYLFYHDSLSNGFLNQSNDWRESLEKI